MLNTFLSLLLLCINCTKEFASRLFAELVTILPKTDV